MEFYSGRERLGSTPNILWTSENLQPEGEEQSLSEKLLRGNIRGKKIFWNILAKTGERWDFVWGMVEEEQPDKIPRLIRYQGPCYSDF